MHFSKAQLIEDWYFSLSLSHTHTRTHIHAHTHSLSLSPSTSLSWVLKVLDALTPKPVQLNLTGILLRDFAELDFNSLPRKKDREKAQNVLTPSALSTVGLRRATESHAVIIYNFCGFDIDINPVGSAKSSQPKSSVRFKSFGPGTIKDSCCASIDSIFDVSYFDNNIEEIAATTKLSLKLASSSLEDVGEREIITDLPIMSLQGTSSSVYILKPVQFAPLSGSESSGSFQSECNAETVVEWCMQTQRLRSSTIDLYSLEKGVDLLSSSNWSPEDYNLDSLTYPHRVDTATLSGENSQIEGPVFSGSPGRKRASMGLRKSEWLRPYLKNDSPEWTDMTCILRMARERVMLPDNNWIWVSILGLFFFLFLLFWVLTFLFYSCAF